LIKIGNQVVWRFKPYIQSHDTSLKIVIWTLQTWVDNGKAVDPAPAHTDFENLQCVDKINDSLGAMVSLKTKENTLVEPVKSRFQMS